MFQDGELENDLHTAEEKHFQQCEKLNNIRLKLAETIRERIIAKKQVDALALSTVDEVLRQPAQQYYADLIDEEEQLRELVREAEYISSALRNEKVLLAWIKNGKRKSVLEKEIEAERQRAAKLSLSAKSARTNVDSRWDIRQMAFHQETAMKWESLLNGE